MYVIRKRSIDLTKGSEFVAALRDLGFEIRRQHPNQVWYYGALCLCLCLCLCLGESPSDIALLRAVLFMSEWIYIKLLP